MPVRVLTTAVVAALVWAAASSAAEPATGRAQQLGAVGDVVRIETPAAGGRVVAFLVPGGATAPRTAVAHLDGADVELGAVTAPVDAAPRGERWAAYAAPQAAGTVSADFVIARGPGGMPDPRRFAWSVTSCDAEACDAAAAGAPVDLRDLRGAGATVVAHQGETVTLPFTWRAVGDGQPVWDLRVAGAPADGRPARLAFAEPGFVDVQVQVRVPVGVPPGDHEVTLIAAAGDAERRAVGVVRVLGDDADQDRLEVLGVSSSRQVRRLDFVGVDVARPGRDGTVELGDVLCFKRLSGCGWVTVALVADGRLLSRHRFALAPSSRVRARIRLGPRTLRRLRSGRGLKALAIVRAAPGAMPVIHRVTLGAA